MSTIVPFPLQYQRQQASPIDVDEVFQSTAERMSYLTSPRRYAGMIVYDTEIDCLFFLNRDRNTWKEIPVGAFTVDFMYDSSEIYNRGSITFEYDSNVDDYVLYLCLVDSTHGILPSSDTDGEFWFRVTFRFDERAVEGLLELNTLQELQDSSLPVGAPYKTASGFIKIK